MIHHGEADLWREVLTAQISDALEGVRGLKADRANRIRQVKEARQFLTTQSKDLDIICSFAGIDPDALRSRMKPMIADAPSPERLIAPKPASKTYTFNGETRTLPEWGEQIGISHHTLRGRLQLGWSMERLFSPIGSQGRKRAVVDDVPGVGLDFRDTHGTGGHPATRDSANIDFSISELEGVS